MSAGIWSPSSGWGDANIALGVAGLQTAITTKTHNRAAVAHPVVQQMLARDAGLGKLTGTLGVQWGKLDIGQGKGSAVAEGSAASAANFSATTVSLTPARKAYARTASDMGVAYQRDLLPAEYPSLVSALAYDAGMVWMNTLMGDITALFPSFSRALSLTGSALLVMPFLDTCRSIQIASGGAAGPLLALLSEQQIKDLNADLSTLGGAVQFSSQAQQAMNVNGGLDAAYWGRLGNIVDVYYNPEVTTDSGDSIGGIMGARSIASKHELVPLQPNAQLMFDLMGMLQCEARARVGTSQSTYDYLWHNALGIDEQACGAKVVSRAS